MLGSSRRMMPQTSCAQAHEARGQEMQDATARRRGPFDRVVPPSVRDVRYRAPRPVPPSALPVRTVPSAPARVRAEVGRSWLERVERWLWRLEQKRVEDYLPDRSTWPTWRCGCGVSSAAHPRALNFDSWAGATGPGNAPLAAPALAGLAHATPELLPGPSTRPPDATLLLASGPRRAPLRNAATRRRRTRGVRRRVLSHQRSAA